MTTKDALAALERVQVMLDCAHIAGIHDSYSDDLATLRAFVTEMGPVREVLERKMTIWHLAGKYRVGKIGTAPTYTAACTAALEAVDGDKEMS